MTAHRLRRAPRLRALVAVLAVITTVLTLGGVAFAYLSATGTGTGSATTGTLNPATGVSGSQVTHTTNVNVSWTAPSSGSTPTGYYVLRTPSPSGTTVAACGTSALTPTVNTTCLDVAVPNGTFTYVVVALFHTWTATSSPSAVVTVVETNQSITFTSSPVAPTVNGTYAVSATGGGSGNPVTFSSATTGVCTVAGSNVSLNHAGLCTINANQAGNAQYNPAPQVQQSFTVAKASQTITYTSTAPSGAVVGGPGYTPTATGGGSGNPVTFTIDASTAANCSINAGVVTYQHVGSCTVNANQAGNADYLPASQVQQSYAIGKGAQAITFTSIAPANAKVSGPTYTVTATGGASGNAVTFTSATPTICSVSGATISFLLAGTCTINANQAGNADYLAAAQIQQSFLVTKTDQTITFTSAAPINAAYQGPTYTVTATATSGLPVAFAIDPSSSGVCTISVATISFTGVGTCTINATQAGNTVYNAAPGVQQSFTVGKAAQTITWNGPLPAKTFGNPAFTISPQATASSGLAITYTSATPSVCTVSGVTVTIVSGGLCTLNADQAGNGLYLQANQVQQSFTVNRLAQTVSFNPTLTATAPSSATLTATASSGLTPVTFSTSSSSSICTVTGSAVNYVGAGSCVLTATQAGNANYSPASASATVTVTPGDLNGPTITMTDPVDGTSGIQWGDAACGNGANDRRVCATVTDPSGVGPVYATVSRASDDKCYDGTGTNPVTDWVVGPCPQLPMSLSSGQYRTAELLSRTYNAEDYYLIIVVAEDTLGNYNQNGSYFILDTGNPSASISPTAPGYTNTGEVTITGSDTLGIASISYRVDANSGSFITEPFTALTLTLAAGSHTVDYFVTDGAGKSSPVVNDAPIIVDLSAAPPVIVDIDNDTGQSSTDNITNDNTQILSGTAEPNATVNVTRTVGGGTASCTDVADGAGVWACPVITLLGGTNSYRATQTDLAGNVSALSSTFTVLFDSTNPLAASFTFPTAGTDYTAATFQAGCSTPAVIDVCGTAADSATAYSSGVWKVEFELRRTDTSVCWSGATYSSAGCSTRRLASGTTAWSGVVGVLNNGSPYTLSVWVTDVSGRESLVATRSFVG